MRQDGPCSSVFYLFWPKQSLLLFQLVDIVIKLIFVYVAILLGCDLVDQLFDLFVFQDGGLLLFLLCCVQLLLVLRLVDDAEV